MNTKIKTLSLSTLTLLFMISCDKSEEIVSSPVPIKLGASITRTKGPVDALPDFDNVGVYGVKDSTWTATPWIDNDQSSVIPATGSISFTGSYFYPSEGDTVTFYAYHPYAATGVTGSNYVTAPSSGTAPSLNFTITGEEDLLYATSVSGSKSNPAIGALNFNHTLTQLKFTAKTGASFPGSVTVTSITFNGVNTKGVMNIANGALSSWGTPSNALTSTILNGGAISTTSTASVVGAPVMLEPGLASFNVTIVTSFGTFSNITINPTGGDTTFEVGKAYTVELTFTASEIELSATVSPWTDTGTGTGSVE